MLFDRFGEQQEGSGELTLTKLCSSPSYGALARLALAKSRCCRCLATAR